MSTISTEIVQLLKYLLPGFLAAWVFYGFTSHPKPSEFERIVQALIFTLIVQAGVYCVEKGSLLLGRIRAIGEWNEHSEILCSIVCAAALGFLFAYFSNTDKFHKLVRKYGITRETSYPSEWFGVFSKNVTYVVLHLTDDRRIYGWPTEWPSEPAKGHFSLEQASWLDEDGKEIQLTGVHCILIRAQDVKWVEFMRKNWEETHGQESSKSTTAPA